jgi:hypothetical protein
LHDAAELSVRDRLHFGRPLIAAAGINGSDLPEHRVDFVGCNDAAPRTQQYDELFAHGLLEIAKYLVTVGIALKA